MNINFKKIGAITASVLMTGMSMGVAAATTYPSPFVTDEGSDIAIVYGSNADASDSVQANKILEYLDNKYSIVDDGEVEDVVLSDGITEDEIELGSSIVYGKIKPTLTDNRIPTLLDEKVDWDDGADSTDFNIHEEIIISDMNIQTTLDDNDFTGIALTNDEGISYRYVFEEDISVDLIGDD
ncbi:unnamed protein product, partial [marine sediment metagenome]